MFTWERTADLGVELKALRGMDHVSHTASRGLIDFDWLVTWR